MFLPRVRFIPLRQIEGADTFGLKLDGLPPELDLGVHGAPEHKVPAPFNVRGIESSHRRMMADLNRSKKF